MYYKDDLLAWPHATGEELRIPLFSIGDKYDVYFVGILHWLKMLAFLVPGYIFGGLVEWADPCL
jgi:hypothetical protein